MLGLAKAHRSKPALRRLRGAGVQPNGLAGMEVPVTILFHRDSMGPCNRCLRHVTKRPGQLNREF
jgi:hypothetical protein